MYTLEDDQETSARLRKRDFANASEAVPVSPEGEAGGTGESAQGTAQPSAQLSQATPVHTRQYYAQQITSSFKKLATPGKTTAATRAEKRIALAALLTACIGVFFTAMDQTVVVTALPKIIADPGINISIAQLDHAAWIVSAYLLGFIIVMPLMGRVSDIFGRRRILLLCLSIFGIGSVLCGLAPTLGQTIDLSFLNTFGIDTSSQGLIWLISARFIQAIGGGAVVPVAMAIVGDFYGQERRGLALGLIGAVTEAGGVIGPLYGALIVQHLGWTYIFYLNVPIVLALMICAWFLTPKSKRLHESIDWLGTLLLGLALTCLSLGLAQQGTELGPTSTTSSTPQNNPVSLALALAFLILFIVVERVPRWRVPKLSLSKRLPFFRLSMVRQTRFPVVDLSLFKRFPFSASSLVSLLVGVALIIAMADIPLYVNTVLSKQVSQADMPLVSGLALLRMTAMIPVGALLGGWLCSRISCRVTGVLGLLFTAVGFYLMSRWPVDVNWTQITISTLTTGLGFGLVISPISTTAINAVRARQAGMGSAIVTSLRMVGMTLGLAALTSWALAYFKHLAAQYPSLPTSATSDQFTKWSQGYADHLIDSAHTVYSSVFFTTMVLCLIAIAPAIFLWGNKPAAETEAVLDASAVPETVGPDPDIYDATTAPVGASATRILPATELLNDPLLAESPPLPPEDNGSGGGNGRRNPRKRRLIIAIVSIGLAVLLIGGGIFAAFLWQSPGPTSPIGTGSGSAGSGSPDTGTATPIAGARMIELALDNGALTSIFVAQLNMSQGPLSDIQVIPAPNDSLIIRLNLHIDSSGIHRIMPIEMDSTLGVDTSGNIQLQVYHLKRDGLDAGPAAAANMQVAMNKLLLTSVMPALRGQLKSARLVSVHTSSSVGCGNGAEMLVLLIQAPPIQGIAAQPTPTALCFKGPIDLNKLLPN